ncbi:putative secreted protein (Por secretion system target) [Ichthyenterobacterium magnum]|uniref:Putative secreted protein (Por secretion system target) n=2 Tax=Ichthyenterobacterium magnum TaxID=1230530 RepID=A0A420DXW6_9FLAO|nr:putative secreted protein (Por secretion system target) [Ichthyenterobacterium magnum]
MKTHLHNLKKSKYALLFLVTILCQLSLMAQKPMKKRSFEISLEADEKINSKIRTDMRVDTETGQPLALYGLNYTVPAGTPEAMAMHYLTHEAKKLGIPSNEIANLRHHATRTTNAGSVVRYRQYIGNYPVNKSEVTISISPENKVVFVMNSFQTNTSSLVNTQPSISEDTAYQLAYNYLNVQSDVMYKANRLMVYSNPKTKRLAHEVTILTNHPMGEWHVFVDAQTQEIFKVVDMANYYNEDNENAQDDTLAPADGTGFVFNPDPLSSNTVNYGGGYVDNNDVASTELNNARISVTLRDIDQTGGTYTLRGPRAQIVDFDAPNTGLFAQNSPTFNFTRQDQGFEPVNIYYHIDFMIDYINNTLGCNVMPYQYSGGVKFDPHGAGGADQSYYTGGTGQLSFGEGCVDDGEDSDVIHHELGHGLHDWVTNGGNSGAEGLGEGTGDYVAQSYNRSLGNWTSTDPQYNWVFNWDGHNECWGGRITNYTATYPGGLTGSIHTDGQIWASCLMGIWDQIGQQRMDKIFWEGLGMTAGTTGQNDAAVAVYQAAINLAYTQSEIIDIHTSLTACGYTLPELPGPPVAMFSADATTLCLDNGNTVNFTDESAPAATSWSWTFEGGTPSSSTEQNPTVTYAAVGTYNVTLNVTNSNGTDQLVETDYINVVQGDDCPACVTPSNSTPVAINNTGDFTSTINIASGGPITDVNATINITHTWDADLDITLTSPQGTIVELTSDNGDDGDDYINTVFDQQAANPITGGTAPFTGSYIPEGDLSTLNGEDSTGDWILTVTDDASGDTGTLNSWSLEVCVDSNLSVEDNDFDTFSIFPNPNDGSFTIKLNSLSTNDIVVNVYDIRGRAIYNNVYKNTSSFNQNIDLTTVQSGIYLVKVTDGERKTTRKIVVE